MMCLLKSNCGNSRVSRPTQSKEFMLVTRQLYLVSAFISVGHSVLQVREPITFRPGKLIELDVTGRFIAIRRRSIENGRAFLFRQIALQDVLSSARLLHLQEALSNFLRPTLQ